jgi:hypothetical protein
MADLLTTIGADMSELPGDLRKAIREQEAYAREIRRIDRSMGSEAAAAYRQVMDAKRAAMAGDKAHIQQMAAGAVAIRESWRTLSAVTARGIAAGGLGFAIAQRAVTDYANRYQFAEARLKQFGATHSRVMNDFQRDMFRTFDQANPENVVAGIGGVRTWLVNAAAAALTSRSTDADRLGMTVPEWIAEGDRLELQRERYDLQIQSYNLSRDLAGADRVEALRASGQTGAAAIAQAELEQRRALQGLNAHWLMPADRFAAEERIGGRFGRVLDRFGSFDASVEMENRARRFAVSLDDGTDEGSIYARRNTVLADAEARARAITVADMTPADRAAALADLRTETERRVAALDREREYLREIAAIEEKRLAAAGQTGLAAQLTGISLDAEAARAQARRDITDPARLARTIAGIDADASERSAAGSAALLSSRSAAIQAARDTIEGLKIENLRGSGRTREAEEAAIRHRYGRIERDMRGNLGASAEPMIEGLRAMMEQALANIARGDGPEILGVAPEFVSGFAGVRGRIGRDREIRLLEKIADNTEGQFAFVER